MSLAALSDSGRPNAYLHTRGFLASLARASSGPGVIGSGPSTPKLAAATINIPGSTGANAASSESGESEIDSASEKASSVVGAPADDPVGLIVNILEDPDEEEDREERLRDALKNVMGKDVEDEDLLTLMHAHKDDLTGAPFTVKRTPSRPASRPASRPWTPTGAHSPARNGPGTPTFGRSLTPLASPSIPHALGGSLPVLPPGLGGSRPGSAPSSPLASPRTLNIKAAEFAPGPPGRPALVRSSSRLSQAPTYGEEYHPPGGDEYDEFSPFATAPPPPAEQFSRGANFFPSDNEWYSPGPSEGGESYFYPGEEPEAGDGMAPLDVLWSIFAPSGISFEDLEQTLACNSFDFERTLNELGERATMQRRAFRGGHDNVRDGRNSGRNSPRWGNRSPAPAGGRVCRYFLAGECRRADCRFSHDIERALCRFWLRGNCIKQNCDFLHELPPQIDLDNTLARMMARSDLSDHGSRPGSRHSSRPSSPSPEEQFPELGAGAGGGLRVPKQRPYVPRWSAAVKTHVPNAPVAPRHAMPGRRAAPPRAIGTGTPTVPRSSPRIRLRPPTLLPTLPTGSALNALYLAYRNASLSIGAARNSLLSRAAEAYRRGDGASAKQFSREANELNERMGAENSEAAGRLVRERRKAVQEALAAGTGMNGYEGDEAGRKDRGKEVGGGLGVCLGMAARESTVSGDERLEALLDLHGLHSSEALEVLEEFLLGLEREHFLGIGYLLVGEQKHTGMADPARGASKHRLAAAVREWLDRWGYPALESNGVIAVDAMTHF